MRISSIKLLSNSSDLITFDIGNTNDSKYIIKSIEGLDTDEINHSFYGFSVDGLTRFYNYGLTKRDIFMKIILNPRYRAGENVSKIRDDIYKAVAFTRSGLLELQFFNGAIPVAKLYGRITKIESDSFSKTSTVIVKVSCEDGIFKGISPVHMKPSDLGANSSISITDDSSSFPHGIELSLTFNQASTSFSIQDLETDPSWKFKVSPSGGFLENDILRMSSVLNNMYVYYLRGVNKTHILDTVDTDSFWPLIFPGRNDFHLPDRAKFDWDYIKYIPEYLGV